MTIGPLQLTGSSSIQLSWNFRHSLNYGTRGGWFNGGMKILCRRFRDVNALPSQGYLQTDTIRPAPTHCLRRSCWRSHDRYDSYVFDWVHGRSGGSIVAPTRDVQLTAPTEGNTSLNRSSAAERSHQFWMAAPSVWAIGRGSKLIMQEG